MTISIGSFYDDIYCSSLEQRLISNLFFIREEEIEKMVLYNNIKLTNQYTINLLKKLEETCIIKTYK